MADRFAVNEERGERWQLWQHRFAEEPASVQLQRADRVRQQDAALDHDKGNGRAPRHAQDAPPADQQQRESQVDECFGEVDQRGDADAPAANRACLSISSGAAITWLPTSRTITQ